MDAGIEGRNRPKLVGQCALAGAAQRKGRARDGAVRAQTVLHRRTTMRSLYMFIAALLLTSLTVTATAAPKKQRLQAYGFATAWSGKAGQIVFDVRHRDDGLTVVRYTGRAVQGEKVVPIAGSFRGKVTAKDRKLSNAFGYVNLPRSAPPPAEKATQPGWGKATDGLDFSIGGKGFDVPLVGFDVPLVGFDVPLVGFDKPAFFNGVTLSVVGGGLNGVAVARKVDGNSVVSFSVKVGGKLRTGSMTDTSSVKSRRGQRGLVLSRGGSMRFNGQFSTTQRNVSGLSGRLSLKVGKRWQSGSARFAAFEQFGSVSDREKFGPDPDGAFK